MKRWIFALIAAAIAGPAIAQDSDADDSALRFENGAFVIEGKVQKPEVVVVITRDNLDKGFNLDLKESFLPRIVEALELPPFEAAPVPDEATPSASR